VHLTHRSCTFRCTDRGCLPGRLGALPSAAGASATGKGRVATRPGLIVYVIIWGTAIVIVIDSPSVFWQSWEGRTANATGSAPVPTVRENRCPRRARLSHDGALVCTQALPFLHLYSNFPGNLRAQILPRARRLRELRHREYRNPLPSVIQTRLVWSASTLW
jgi:hypothetical protein